MDVAPVPVPEYAPLTHPYITGLNRWVAERRAQRAEHILATKRDPRAALRRQVQAWWDALPPHSRAPRYALEELTPLFNCSPQQLGVALYELGWRRTRVWLDDGPYRRYWLTPKADHLDKFKADKE